MEEFNYQMPPKFRNKILKYSHQPVSSTSGIIRFLTKPGEVIKKGQPLARIYNAFGKIQEIIVAQVNGIVLGHSDYSVAFPGVAVVSLGVF